MANFHENIHSTMYPNGPVGTIFPGDEGLDTGGTPEQDQLEGSSRRAWAWHGIRKGDGKR